MKSPKLSRSFRCEGYNTGEFIDHNNRKFIAKNVDPNRICDNVVFVQQDIKEKYNELFSKALEEYNAKKKKTRDKIPDYYEHIKNGSKEKLYYETVVQFGDKDNCGVGSTTANISTEMLTEYINNFEKRNPHLKVFNAVMHLDEATPHLHIDFVPVATEQKRGLSTRVSLSAALSQQGFIPKSRSENEVALWGESERNEMERIAQKYGIQIENKFDYHTHVNVDEYKKEKDKLREIQEHTAELMKKSNGKSAAEITDDELDLIRNENEFIKKTLSKKEQEIQELSKKKAAPYLYYQIHDDQKLSFIAETLLSKNISVVEDTRGIHIPEYAINDFKEAAKKYVPKMLTGRQLLKLTIDRLVYSVDSVDELYSELRARGYTVRFGKHISIKPDGADRAIRTKSLGEDYTPEKLTERIFKKRDYEKVLKIQFERSASENELLCDYYSVTKTVVSMIYTTTKYPQKYNSEKMYTMENDFHINELTDMLNIIKREAFTNIEDVKNISQTLQSSIDDMANNVDKLSKMQALIKDIVIKADYVSKNKDKQLDYTGATNLRAAQEFLERNKITSDDDIEKLKAQYAENEKALAILKEKIPKAKARQNEYNKVIDNYELVINGNYIDRLVQIEREKREKEEQQRKKSSEKT